MNGTSLVEPADTRARCDPMARGGPVRSAARREWMVEMTTVLWYRRDLRVHDHPGLHRAIAAGDPIAPVFVVDDRLVAGRWRSRNRLWFMRGSVAALATALEARGAPLTVLRGDPVDVLARFAEAVGAKRVVASRDYAPYGRERDARVAERLAARGVAWEAIRGVLVREPEAIRPRAGGSYRVFGPFLRAWSSGAVREVLPAPETIPGLRPSEGAGSIEQLLGAASPTADPDLLPVPGEAAARRRLDAWAGSAALERYARDRDRLDLAGTSRLGQDLRWGLLSPVEVAARCAGPDDGRERYLAEIAWRDFYAHLLWHEPRVARESFRPELDRVAWTDDARLIDAWRLGRTGYPVVDAAMRQLRASGWMHNRARMVAASFLTKHLGVDWRVGEAHFMEHLVDGDPASNNGGWQWAASTGTDAQPWFRIFNPTLQGRRHDPDGAYVRRWIPELAGVAGETVHQPPPGTYLPPIVDHAGARRRALAAYRAAAGGAESLSR